MKIKGFKPTGHGPKSGFSFSSKAGFSGSTGRTQEVSGYTRKLPHHSDTRGRAQVKIGPGGSPKPVGDGKVGNKKIPHFAAGGFVAKMRVAEGTDGGSALTRRTQPITGFDKEAGGKSPLRAGFKKGGAAMKDGKPCYAEGGKVATVGAAIKLLKTLMARGESADSAAAKAARRYGLSKADVAGAPPAQGGGGMGADKQMLAVGGMARGMPMRAAPMAPPKRMLPAPAARPAPPAGPSGPTAGFGSFRRGPLVR